MRTKKVDAERHERDRRMVMSSAMLLRGTPPSNPEADAERIVRRLLKQVSGKKAGGAK